MLKKIALATILMTSILTSALLGSPPIPVGNLSISGNCWIRPSTGPNTAAYLTIANSSGQPDRLIKVECEEATTVELHDHIHENGVMKMRPVEFIEIGKDPVSLKPGSLHIMLMGLKESFQGKEKIPLTLHFEKAGPVTIDFSVEVPKPTTESRPKEEGKTA